VVYFTIGAALALWIRSFSELVISTKYHPVHDGTSAAREAIYGLCTVLFLYLIKSSNEDLNFSPDPLLKQIEEDTRRYILRAVSSDVTAGRRLPALRTILSTIQSNHNLALSTETKQEINSLSEEERQRIRMEHESILVSLILRYGDLGVSDANHG
jgi:hypothetical protein